MRTVRDEAGRRYLLLKESNESSLVRDPRTGEKRYVDNDDLSPAGGESPLETAARAVSGPVRHLVTAVHDERTLGLLVELVERGPLAAREVVGAYDLCESDVHGALLEFQAAGLIEEVEVTGERGYDATEQGREAVEVIRADGP